MKKNFYFLLSFRLPEGIIKQFCTNNAISCSCPKFTFKKGFLLFLLVTLSVYKTQAQCGTRAVSNVIPCLGDPSGFCFFGEGDATNFVFFKTESLSFQECANGTAILSGTMRRQSDNHIWEIQVNFSGYSTNEAAHASVCGFNSTSDWYYYQSFSGTMSDQTNGGTNTHTFVGSMPLQIGTGAGINDSQAGISAAGWLNFTSYDPSIGFGSSGRLGPRGDIYFHIDNPTSGCLLNSISVNVGQCSIPYNTYSLTGSSYITSPPNNTVNALLYISVDNQVKKIIQPPFPNTVNYTLDGLISDGTLHTITTTFNANGVNLCTLSNTFTAPPSCGCIKPTPTVNSPTICAGSSATLTVSNCAGTVTWDDGTTGLSKTVNPTSYKTYTATCAVGTCTGTATSMVTVTPKPTPTVNSPTICAGSSATLTVSNCSGSVTWNDGTAGLTKTVSPITTLSYTATCIVGTCTGTATSTVAVTPKPTPTVNSPTICSGSSATLTVSNCAGSVTWNDGVSGVSRTVSPSATTIYTATCNVGTCTGTATSTVTVTPKPTPTVNSPTICAGSSATLTISNCSGSVTWNDGTTGLTKTVSPTTTTTYTTTCAVGTCTGTATSTITVTPKPTPTVNSPTICAGSSTTLTVSNCSGSVTWNDGTTGITKTVSPTTTTTYTATCAVGTCTGTATSTVTVTQKPTPTVNSPTICAGRSATLMVSNCSGSVTWNDGTTGLTKSVSPIATTSYTATCAVGTCTGTATSTVTVTQKPTPTVNSPTICAGSSATLTVSNCSGSVTWNDGTTGLTKTVSPITTNTYTATCNVGTCTGTATSTVTVTPKPTVTINTTITCSADLTTYSITFTSNGTVTSDKGTLSGTTVSGIPTGQTVTLTASLNGCTATASATKSCSCPTINPPVGTSKEICEGDAIPALTATVDAGLQADWYSSATSTTKLSTGLSYTPTIAGDFYVEAVNPTSGCKSTTRTKVSLVVNPKPTLSTQATCAADGLTYSVTVTTNATSISADKGTVSGMSITGIPSGQTVTITATSAKGCKTTATATQSCTTPCVLPNFKVTTPATCTNNNSTWSVAITVTKPGIIKVNKGVVSGSGTGPFTITGIPISTNLVITDSLSLTCKKDTTIAAPTNCNNCISQPPITSSSNLQVCKGDTFPTIRVTIVGTGTVDWYKQATGGTPIATATLKYKPTGLVTATDSFFVQAVNTDVNCPFVNQRTKIVVNAINCIDTVDLHLTKKVDKKIVQIGDVITYTIKVWNESAKNATGVEVTDNLPAGVKYVSSVVSRGNYVSSTGIWTIGNIAALSGTPIVGDTVTLSIKAKVIAEGVTFNTAEITKADQKDKDSTPGNGVEGEDDLDRVCITTPIKLCAGQGVDVTIPSTYTGIVWKDAQGNIVPSNGNTVTFTKAGTYTFTATNGSCPTGGCCPVIIEEINCCPAQICIPLTIVKKRVR